MTVLMRMEGGGQGFCREDSSPSLPFLILSGPGVLVPTSFWLSCVSPCIPLPRDSFCSFLLFFWLFSPVRGRTSLSTLGAFQDSPGPSAWKERGRFRWDLLAPCAISDCHTSQSPDLCDAVNAPSPFPRPTAEGRPQPRLAT